MNGNTPSYTLGLFLVSVAALAILPAPNSPLTILVLLFVSSRAALKDAWSPSSEIEPRIRVVARILSLLFLAMTNLVLAVSTGKRIPPGDVYPFSNGKSINTHSFKLFISRFQVSQQPGSTLEDDARRLSDFLSLRSYSKFGL